jgi:hypothetical protein
MPFISLTFVSDPQFGSFFSFCLSRNRDRIHGLKRGCVRGADAYTYILTIYEQYVLYLALSGTGITHVMPAPCIYIMCPAYAGLTLY